jgi:hypothetical protein
VKVYASWREDCGCPGKDHLLTVGHGEGESSTGNEADVWMAGVISMVSVWEGISF